MWIKKTYTTLDKGKKGVPNQESEWALKKTVAANSLAFLSVPLGLTVIRTCVLLNAMLLNVPISYHPLIYLFRRKYSTDKNLQLQLSKDIRYVHNYLKADNLIPSITPFQLSSILQKIENSSYKIGPLECLTCLEEDMNKLLKDILPDYPDIHISVNKINPERIMIIKASNIMDHLVLIGLSATLHRLIYGSLPQNGFRLLDRFPAFLQSIEDMNNVDMLYKVDMSASISVITKAQVLKAVKPFVGDNDYVFRLVSSLFELPILTKAFFSKV